MSGRFAWRRSAGIGGWRMLSSRGSRRLYSSDIAPEPSAEVEPRSRSESSDARLCRRLPAGVARIGLAFRFDKQNLYLLPRARSMHDAPRHHEQIASPEGLRRPAFEIHRHLALEDVEKIVRRVVFVEGKFALELHDHDVVVVVVGHHVRFPVGREEGELLE